MDKAMKKAQDILEKMHDLAELAQDKGLTDSDRVEIQIELADLNDNLFMIPENLLKEKNISRDNRDNWQESQMSSILERMRTRINNGENWNVREVWQPDTTIRLKHDSDGAEIYEISEPGWYTVSDDVNIKSQSTLTSEITQTDKKVPTVKERLEAMTPYVVMDSKSAEKSSELIQSQINTIQEWRDALPERIAKTAGDSEKIDPILTEAFDFLDSLARLFTVGGIRVEMPSLNAPDTPSYYLFGDEVYNRLMNDGQMITLNEDGERILLPGYDISLREETQQEFFASVNKLSGSVLQNMNSGSSIIYASNINH